MHSDGQRWPALEGTDVYTYDSDPVAERKRREIRRVLWMRQKKSTREEEVEELHSWSYFDELRLNFESQMKLKV
jgi:hypothetical protein